MFLTRIYEELIGISKKILVARSTKLLRDKIPGGELVIGEPT
jgi:hypothetical protein